MIERIAAALNVDSLQLFQPDSVSILEKQFDVEKLKDSLIKNIEKAVEMTMKEI